MMLIVRPKVMITNRMYYLPTIDTITMRERRLNTLYCILCTICYLLCTTRGRRLYAIFDVQCTMYTILCEREAFCFMICLVLLHINLLFFADTKGVVGVAISCPFLWSSLCVCGVASSYALTWFRRWFDWRGRVSVRTVGRTVVWDSRGDWLHEEIAAQKETDI